MKNLLAASAIMLAFAAPAAAQMADTDASNIHRTRDQGSVADQTTADQMTYGANGGVDATTTQSIAPLADYGLRAGRDDSSPMREDTSDNYSRAVGGRAN